MPYVYWRPNWKPPDPVLPYKYVMYHQHRYVIVSPSKVDENPPAGYYSAKRVWREIRLSPSTALSHPSGHRHRCHRFPSPTRHSQKLLEGQVAATQNWPTVSNPTGYDCLSTPGLLECV